MGFCLIILRSFRNTSLGRNISNINLLKQPARMPTTASPTSTNYRTTFTNPTTITITLSPPLMEQQTQINRLNYVALQWSTDEPCRVSEGPRHYHNAGSSRLTHCSTPNMSPVPQHYHHHRQYDRQGHQRYNHYDQRSQHHSRQELDQRRYPHTLPNTGQQFQLQISSPKCFRKPFSKTSTSLINT